MGERAAHLTSALQTKPSIFEVIAQESLAELIEPASKRIIQVLVAKNPNINWLSNWFDELYLLANGLVQFNYLKRCGGSFSESFYGLQRVPLSQDYDKHFLRYFKNKEECLSLVSLTLLPYLGSKLIHFMDKCNEEEKFQGLVKYVVALQGVWRGATLVQYLMYLTGKSHTHSLLLRLIKVSLHYAPEQPEYNWTDYIRKPHLYGLLLWGFAGRALELSIFFLQCLQWWQSEEFNRKTISNPIPPPPVVENLAEQSSICPVCKDLCQIETVLSVSGYVFCYRCIYGALIKYKACPVSGLPASLDDLIRLHVSE